MRLHTTHLLKRLAFETLETRSLLSGVTAVLDHGMLTVTGASDSSVDIHVWRRNTRIMVDGVVDTFAASQVQAITVACGATGDQTVNLGINTARGQTALGRAVTVDAGSGNETVRWGATNVYFAGTSHELSVSAKGAARLDGAKLDWFDTNIRDAGIRTLAKASYTDRVLGRTDMLAIFDVVEQSGGVTALELGDLQTIARCTALFTGVAYVQNLSAKLALGNAANAHYQGETLGDLAAGDTAEHLEKLVNKWFLGLDRPEAVFDSVTYVYEEAQASLFPYAPVYTDVRQGYVGDCYLLAGLAEIAMHDRAAIQNMFIVNGDGTYTVRFYNGRVADYVTVDSYFPATPTHKYACANCGQSIEDTTIALWVPLAEKAYAQINEEGWLRTEAANSYRSLNGGWPHDVFRQVTGRRAAGQLQFTKAVNFVQFVSAYRAGSMQCLVSKTETTNPLIAENHVYAVVKYDASTRSVLVFNPWGINNGSPEAGLVWLTWSDVAANFRSWSRTQ